MEQAYLIAEQDGFTAAFYPQAERIGFAWRHNGEKRNVAMTPEFIVDTHGGYAERFFLDNSGATPEAIKSLLETVMKALREGIRLDGPPFPPSLRVALSP